MKLHDNKTHIGSIANLIKISCLFGSDYYVLNQIGSIIQTAIFVSTSVYQGPMIKLYECGLDRHTFSGRSLEVIQQLSTLCHVMASMLYQGLVTCKFYLCSKYVEFMLAECGLDRHTFSGRSLEVTQQLSTLCHVMASMLYQGLVTCKFYLCSKYVEFMLAECGLDRHTFSGRSLEVTQQLSTLCHVMASMLYQGLVTCKFYLCSKYVEFMLAIVAMCDS